MKACEVGKFRGIEDRMQSLFSVLRSKNLMQCWLLQLSWDFHMVTDCMIDCQLHLLCIESCKLL